MAVEGDWNDMIRSYTNTHMDSQPSDKSHTSLKIKNAILFLALRLFSENTVFINTHQSRMSSTLFSLDSIVSLMSETTQHGPLLSGERRRGVHRLKL